MWSISKTQIYIYRLRIGSMLIIAVIFFVGVVTIFPKDESTTYVNGAELNQPMRLTTGTRIILGNNHVFRFINPAEGKGWCHGYLGI